MISKNRFFSNYIVPLAITILTLFFNSSALAEKRVTIGPAEKKAITWSRDENKLTIAITGDINSDPVLYARVYNEEGYRDTSNDKLLKKSDYSTTSTLSGSNG